ncbi:MAG TPA: hypothetical protein VI028_10340 [Solirubrobacterales bacterium]
MSKMFDQRARPAEGDRLAARGRGRVQRDDRGGMTCYRCDVCDRSHLASK